MNDRDAEAIAQSFVDMAIDEVDREMEAEPLCPMCSGVGRFMGYLGKLAWYSCRNCGMEFNPEEVDSENL